MKLFIVPWLQAWMPSALRMVSTTRWAGFDVPANDGGAGCGIVRERRVEKAVRERDFYVC